MVTRGPAIGANCGAAGAAAGAVNAGASVDVVSDAVASDVGSADDALAVDASSPGAAARGCGAAAPSRSSTVRRAWATADEPRAAVASSRSLLDNVANDAGASKAWLREDPVSDDALDAGAEPSTGAGAGARSSSMRCSMRAIDSRAFSTAVEVVLGSGALGVTAASGATNERGATGAGALVRGAGAGSARLVGVTTASPDQIGERSAIAGSPAAATVDIAPITTSAAAAAAKSTLGDHARRLRCIGAAASLPRGAPRIDGATVAITSGASTGIATWAHASPRAVSNADGAPAAETGDDDGAMYVPRVDSDARGVASRPWRAAAIQSSSSWNHGRGNSHDTSGAERSPVPLA